MASSAISGQSSRSKWSGETTSTTKVKSTEMKSGLSAEVASLKIPFKILSLHWRSPFRVSTYLFLITVLVYSLKQWQLHQLLQEEPQSQISWHVRSKRRVLAATIATSLIITAIVVKKQLSWLHCWPSQWWLRWWLQPLSSTVRAPVATIAAIAVIASIVASLRRWAKS